MDKKRILIVSRSFYPSISPRSFRTTELAKEMARQGHEVTVITCFLPGIDYAKISEGLTISFKNLGIEKLRPLQLNGNKIAVLFKRLINRLAQMAIEFPDIQLMFKVAKSLKNEKKYDLLISVAVPYPVHWGVAWRRNKKNPIAKTWIADCGDPYMGDRMDTFRKWFYFKYVEKWFSRKADYLTIPIEEAKSAYYKEFHSKIRVIPQGFNFNEIAIPDYLFPNSPVTFAYAGGFITGK
jgi:glycosyltransferase involved in cell wall biosynthesis